MIERGVMMELKMFSKPVVFTDFDGVLNAFPDDKLLRRSGVNKVMTWAKPDSPYAKMYNPEKAFHLDGNEKAHTPVGSWRIHWSSELSDAMYALAVDGIVELWWLSTWQPYCSQILDPMLGWDPMLVDVITWYDPVTKWGRETGKWQTIQRRVRIECEENEPAPIVWIDDDECFEQRAQLLEELQPKAPVLMVRPDYRIGISRRQWKLIDTFVHHSEQFDTVWDQNMKHIKPWYEPREDDVILTASFDITVGEACRRLGVQHLVSSTIDGNTLNVNYLNFNTNKPKRFRELYGDNVRVDEFYTDSRFDQPMIDMARRAYMVKGNKIHQVK